MLPNLAHGSYGVCNPGEKPLCPRRGGALIAAVSMSRILASKNDKEPAAAKNVGESGNVSPMRSGDRSIRIIFAASTNSKRKPMVPGLNTRNGIVSGILNMFAAMPGSSKNAGRSVGNRNLNR